MRSQTDEQLAAWWDTEPYVDQDGNRWTAAAKLSHFGSGRIFTWEPRVECIPNAYANQPYRKAVDEQGREVWRHRPPVNPILVMFRESERFTALDYLKSVSNPHNYWATHFPQEQIDHAHKVLTRLAALA